MAGDTLKSKSMLSLPCSERSTCHSFVAARSTPVDAAVLSAHLAVSEPARGIVMPDRLWLLLPGFGLLSAHALAWVGNPAAGKGFLLRRRLIDPLDQV